MISANNLSIQFGAKPLKFWEVMQERDRIYSLPEMSDEEGILVAHLEVEFAEMDGYSVESRAGELLEGIGIPVDQHHERHSTGLEAPGAPRAGAVFRCDRHFLCNIALTARIDVYTEEGVRLIRPATR